MQLSQLILPSELASLENYITLVRPRLRTALDWSIQIVASPHESTSLLLPIPANKIEWFLGRDSPLQSFVELSFTWPGAVTSMVD